MGLRLDARNLVGALAATLALAGCDRLDGSPHVRQAPDAITIAVLPRGDPDELERRWKPLLDDMAAQTGLKVRPYFAPGFGPLVEAMRLNRTQAGWIGNVSGLEAVRRADAEVFASADFTAEQGLASVLVVRANSPITLDQVLRCGRRLSFGLGDHLSTAGMLAPMADLFAPRGVEPNACFKSVREANPQANLTSVASGALDVAAADTLALAAMTSSHPDIAQKVKVIWTSPKLPGEPVIWRKDLDPSVKEKLRAFLLGYGKAPGAEGVRQRKVLAELGVGIFRSDDDRHFLPIQEMQANQALFEARNAKDVRAMRAAEAELARIRRAAAKASTAH